MARQRVGYMDDGTAVGGGYAPAVGIKKPVRVRADISRTGESL